MGLYYPQCRALLKTVFDGFGGGESDPLVVHVLPKRATVGLNGYKEADTFALEFDGRELPFSPELVKAVAVEIFLFQTDGLDNNEAKYATEENLILSGIGDDAGFELQADGSTFRLTGRDYTSLLIAKLWPVDKRIPVGRPIEDVVQDLVNEAVHSAQHGGNTLKVVSLVEGTTPTTGGESKGVTRKTVKIKAKTAKTGVISGHHGSTNKRGLPVKSGQTYWDVIYGLCLSHGLICYVRQNDLIIGSPKALTQELADEGVKVSYGRNLRSLHVDRHLGREQVPQIVASCYDPKTRTQITAKFPSDAEVLSKASVGSKGSAAEVTGIGTVKETILRVSPPASITSEAVLRDYVKAYYEHKTRAEAKYKWETKSLRDLDGNDLTKLRVGQPTSVFFDAFDSREMLQRSPSQRETYLRSIGYSPQVANLVANNFEKIKQFRVPFYARNVNFEWDNKTGLDVACEAVNYVAVKRDEP
jgi:hypothetical protein